MTPGEEIRWIRDKLGWSQQRLGEAARGARGVVQVHAEETHGCD